MIGDGTIVRTDAEHDPELLWALRGGGGSFGVVTALEFSLFDIPTAYAGMMIFDIGRAAEVLRRWAAWAAAAPDEVTTSFRILHLPPLPELPPFLSGRSVVVIDGAVLAPDDAADRMLAELRALRPEMDTFLRVPAAALTRLHMDPEGSGSGFGGSAMLTELPETGIDAFLGAVGDRSTTSLMMAELRQLGGALARPAAGGGAVSHLDGQFLAFGTGMVFNPEMALRVGADVAAFTGVPGSVDRRAHVPELRRGHGRPAPGLRRADVASAEPASARPSIRAASSRRTTRYRGSTRTVARPADRDDLWSGRTRPEQPELGNFHPRTAPTHHPRAWPGNVQPRTENAHDPSPPAAGPDGNFQPRTASAHHPPPRAGHHPSTDGKCEGRRPAGNPRRQR